MVCAQRSSALPTLRIHLPQSRPSASASTHTTSHIKTR
jgi:hypothetical protein